MEDPHLPQLNWQPDWIIEIPDLAVVAVPDDAKDEFLHHLFAFMRSSYDHGHSSQTIFVPGIGRVQEWKLNTSDGRERPRLWLVNRNRALGLALAGQGEQRAEDVETWQRGIEAALANMGKRQDFPWMAILSQVPTFENELAGIRLSASGNANGLTFQLLQGCFAEDTSVNFGGISMRDRFHWPIRVDGTTAAYVWEQDGDWRTMQRLRRVAAVLSLAWDRCLTVREGPRPPERRFANARGPLTGRSWIAIPDDSDMATGFPVTLPDWLGHAEDAITKKPRLGHALLMHHEGLLLSRDHSSLALVCFVAAVETMAQINKNPDRCEICESVTSSTQRFKDAIQPMLDDGDAALLGNAYSKRSKTVHQGRLFGAELSINSWGAMSLFQPDHVMDFTFGTVSAARRASRRLLLSELGINWQELV